MRSLLAALLLCCTLLAPAQAQTSASVPVIIHIAPGPLSVVSAGGNLAFESVQAGQAQTVTALQAPRFHVVDARGSGAGWNLTLRAAAAPGLPASLYYANQSLAAPVKVLSQAPGSGMGSFDYTPAPDRFRLVLPAAAPAGTYVTTLTASITSGP
ncbi:MAG: hypothetical protein ACYCW6_16930 [Candidatus Xenobia bacterium]